MGRCNENNQVIFRNWPCLSNTFEIFSSKPPIISWLFPGAGWLVPRPDHFGSWDAISAQENIITLQWRDWKGFKLWTLNENLSRFGGTMCCTSSKQVWATEIWKKRLRCFHVCLLNYFQKSLFNATDRVGCKGTAFLSPNLYINILFFLTTVPPCISMIYSYWAYSFRIIKK